jgi:hypothetical protein
MALTEQAHFLAWMKRLDAGGDDNLAGIKTLRDDDLRLIEPQNIDVADRNRLGRRIDIHTAGCCSSASSAATVW